ncbi:BRCA1-A complex subunit BRE-like protein [Perilla frutescens var. hirtella]|uniref:BRISC and BRCA1-A complex member 2 n=1 Tax=Perilla frutescens var. hirtella TaxID=608512 RepID=A0AAD4IXT4_PERFH|nr:BRCA1-A complex subunit BRE-like protein [Perilla frutescens var. frutescens]KAH6823023.1 BRCA1-A complex subunit BRE-like protein [Perilla frutescens var. hirtella]
MGIDTVPPLITAQINYLLSHCPFSVKVEQMWSGCKNPNYLDRFSLVIPYCLDHIKCGGCSGKNRKKLGDVTFKALFSIEDFKLPTWVDGMCTVEYRPILGQMLNSQIKDAISSIEARRKFIQSLTPHFGRPIEADPVFCRKATVLSSSQTFTFLVGFIRADSLLSVLCCIFYSPGLFD